jgi:hypothetical protein
VDVLGKTRKSEKVGDTSMVDGTFDNAITTEWGRAKKMK